MNPTGTGYCPAFLGDPVGSDFLYYWTRLVMSNATQICNTERRFDYNCLRSLPVTWGQAAIAANLQYLNYPLLQGNDKCVQEIYMAWYWDGASVLIASGLVLGLF